ncbi:dnaJ homolog subfamily C member 17-like [Ananas comosus]|uniref:DnaJ homolog subfamily C member 17-like n=1 Tax=Ananas comosus TaxID=4615 RepID=A0A199W5F8_ANACO|nr:dnaJ homolog subfamily C member 17-like [Ananas comosus]OAY84549.1 DnaJ subfamily C member 17 [Ananas comosus]
MASGGVGAAVEEEIDHYEVLRLPSGEEGARLTLDQIDKAYKGQSRVRHPDKRPDDPSATADFQRLRASYDVLRDEAARRSFDARLRARRDRALRDSARDTKRRKLAADLDERERAAAARDGAPDPAELAELREKKVAAQLQRELEEFLARKANKSTPASASTSGQEKREGSEEKEKMLKVSWERSLGDYTAAKLKEIFERFGEVEDIVIRSKKSKSKASAIVVMSSKDAVEAATHSMSGSLSNPLLVLPLVTTAGTSDSFSAQTAETSEPKVSNIVGAGFNEYEAMILKKLQEASKRKKGIQ